MTRALAVVAPILVALSCSPADERRREEAYAARVTGILQGLARTHARFSDECQRGMLACSVAAGDAGDATRRARSELLSATPPRKLAAAHRKLLDCTEHLALAYDDIAETYWNRADALEAYTGSVRHMEASIRDLASAAVVIGFKGDGEAWRPRR